MVSNINVTVEGLHMLNLGQPSTIKEALPSKSGFDFREVYYLSLFICLVLNLSNLMCKINYNLCPLSVIFAFGAKILENTANKLDNI